MKEPKRTVLWSATGQQANNTSIELTDSIDNYDELWFYGSGTRTYTPCVITEYPVIPGVVNLGGPFFAGQWGSTDTFLLCNGTQVFLSGNSGFVASSYYFGKNNGSTAWAAALVNNRINDIRPFKIVGLKYKADHNRATLWESTGLNLYNQDISLSEPLTHFDTFEVYSSGFENAGVGCRHAGKNIYQTQPLLMNCGSWAYTPWKYAECHNLLIGEEMLISGNSGHIRSGFYWGMGNQTTAYVAGRWNSDYALSALQPYKIVGIDHKPILNLNLINSEHGTISADTSTGCEYDYVNLEATPNEGWYFSGYSISGAQLTGNQFRFNNSDVTVEGGWTDQGYPITYENDGHGTLTGDTDLYIPGGTGITLTANHNTYYRLSGYDVTGGTVQNGVLIPTGPCTAKAVYKVNYFTATGNFNYSNNTSKANKDINYSGICKGITGEIPNTWYDNNSAWKPTNPSAYSISTNPSIRFYLESYKANFTGRIDLNGAAAVTKTAYLKATGTVPHPTTTVAITTTNKTTTGSLKLHLITKSTDSFTGFAHGWNNISNNSWTATGIAP